jgi:hypothetical protein
MKILKTHFRKNDLFYTLIKRNDKVALYGIGGEFTNSILHWEVDIIYIRKDKYGEREHIADNENFGRDRSRCYMRKDLAYKYFDKLTTDLRNERNLPQGVPKVTTGVDQYRKVILEYQSEVET